jgi:hypothetical protein
MEEIIAEKIGVLRRGENWRRSWIRFKPQRRRDAEELGLLPCGRMLGG